MIPQPDIRPPEYWREHYRLDRMDIGAKVAVNAGYVVRVRRHEYVLHHLQTSQRARWGTAEQIAEDISYIEAYGVLPPICKGSRGIW